MGRGEGVPVGIEGMAEGCKTRGRGGAERGRRGGEVRGERVGYYEKM